MQNVTRHTDVKKDAEHVQQPTVWVGDTCVYEHTQLNLCIYRTSVERSPRTANNLPPGRGMGWLWDRGGKKSFCPVYTFFVFLTVY